ncbi:MAG: hypothetical protein EBV89_10060, partial [Betaproteobacteria bacterium]|nr:hypothetical protein [Betaproteobacteria bacterium]
MSVTGGTGAYTYLWSNGATTASLTNLAAGSYSLTVTDANGCTASSNVTVGSLASLTASASVSSPILCNGGTTTVNITATGGAAPYTGTGSLANVTAGTYTYTVTDVNGCTASTTLTVTEPTPLVASINVLNPIACNGGVAVIEVVATGGTPTYLGTGPIPGLAAGTHTYTITDANNCPASASITLAEPAVLALSTSVVDVSCNAGASGAIDLTVTGGTAPYTYLWNDPNAS